MAYLGKAVWDASRDGLALVKHGIRAHIKHLVTGLLLKGGDDTAVQVHLIGQRCKDAGDACQGC